MKKILALVLALLMAVSCASMALAADTAAIPEEAPKLISAAEKYADAIGVLEQKGIMKGVDPNTFDPDADSAIQRYQMALFVGRIVTGWTNDQQWTDGNVNNSGFTDLDGTPAQNFYGAISYASQKGIIEGYGDGKFGPTDGITYRDALTMVVRALGYGGGLKYPWGYIEKAESLGLTKGISGVAYTTPLNRGEVAQIIYNALFVTTAAGDTLAARNFGENLGTKKIMVTVTKRGALDKADAGKWKDVPSSKTIGFKVIGEDGTLGDTTYYVDYTQLGLKNAHEAYDALGRAYSALFTVKGDNIVEILGYKDDLVLTPAENTGLTSADKDGKYPIEKALAGLTLKDKYSKSSYIVKYGTTYDGEIIVRDKTGEKATVIGGEGKYAIDWTTGDILVKDDKGTVEVDGVKYSAKYFYNSLLGKYFEVKTKDVAGSTVSGDVKIVGITLIDDIFAALGATKTDDTYKGGYTILDSLAGNSAYALLEMYDINGDTKADWAMYTEYRLGQYIDKDVKGTCPNGDGDKAAFTIKSLNGNAAKAWALANGKSEAEYDNYPVVDKLVKEGACDHGEGFIDERGLTPSNGDYILYAYNPSTRGVYVKAIIDTDKSDNTYVATGLLRAYDITGSKRTVTIGEDKLDFDYVNLAGNGMLLPENANALSRAIYSAYLNDKFMNFVKYVVVDGKLVWIEDALVTNGTKYIVVDSYAGVSADGYVVVNGYRSDALKYEQIRIGAYDQWLQGDIFNYFGLNYDFDDLFAKHVVYKVTSYDAANDAYYVESDINLTGTEETILWKDGYYSKVVGDKYDAANEKKAKADDTFIFVLDPKEDDLGYAPIQVYTGKAGEGWTFTGKKVTDNIYIDVKLDDNFKKTSAYALTYGLLVSVDYTSAKYVSASEATGKLLLGATYYNAIVLDLYKGEYKDVKVLNKNLTAGLVYPVINGQIVARSGYNTDGFGASEVEITLAGRPLILENARPTTGYKVASYDADTLFNKDNKLSIALTGHKDNIKNLNVFKVTTSGEKITAKSYVYDDYKADLKAAGVSSFDAYIVYGWKGAAEGDKSFATIYVVYQGESKTVGEAADEDIANAIQMGDEPAYIVGTVESAQTTVVDKDGTSTITAKVSEIELNWTGKATKSYHNLIRTSKYYFGDADACKGELWNTTVNDAKNYKSLNAKVYSDHADETEDCDLIQAIKVDGLDLTVKKGDKIALKFNGKKWDGKTITDGVKTYTDSLYEIYIVVDEVDGKIVYKFEDGSQVVPNELTAKVVALSTIVE
ncbi:MAG: S-layer homology domain-containing protein [Oscillospiraceae bacterium]|nr:S-layer homology domain-containing protein [Oscillospiraceae bacterium]